MVASHSEGSEARRYYQSQSDASAHGTVYRRVDTCMQVNVDSQSLPTGSYVLVGHHRYTPFTPEYRTVWASVCRSADELATHSGARIELPACALGNQPADL